MQVAENYLFNWIFCLWMFRQRFDVGTKLGVFELNVKKPTFAQQEKYTSLNGFLRFSHGPIFWK